MLVTITPITPILFYKRGNYMYFYLLSEKWFLKKNMHLVCEFL